MTHSRGSGGGVGQPPEDAGKRAEESAPEREEQRMIELPERTRRISPSRLLEILLAHDCKSLVDPFMGLPTHLNYLKRHGIAVHGPMTTLMLDPTDGIGTVVYARKALTGKAD